MFDISWTEFLLIGVVALIVIGPKELPAVMRTMGQWMRKVRGMANEFQNQFQEALREAEMSDLKKQVDDMAHDFKNYDPLKGVRDDVNAMGKDFNKDFERSPDDKPKAKPAEPSAEQPASSESASAELVAADPDTPAGPASTVETHPMEPLDLTPNVTQPEPATNPPDHDKTGRPE
jgi:sec-independent protein translocase protein TatB